MRISLLNAVVQTILPRTSNTLSYPGVQRQLYPFIHSTTTTKAYSKMAENRERVNKAAWIVEEKGKFEVRDAPIIEPEKGQVLVRVEACALTPADALFATTSFRKLTYPTIFSSTVAGYVESLGEGVTKVKVGDRVVSGTSIWTSGGDHRYGGMQRFTVVEEYEAMEIGDVDFGEAIAGAIQVGASAIFGKSTLNMDRPTNPLNPTPNGKKILIWGGASAMGALGIRHASAAGYTVISTSSPKNFSLLKERGAAHVFDYNDESTIDQIRNLFPIDYFYDCVSLPESIGALIKLLSPPNLPVVKADILTLVPASMFGSPELPEGVTTKMMLFRNGDEENKEYVEWLLKKDGYLQTGLKEGWIRGVRPESIGGLEAVDAGIRRRALPGLKGVSGARLIVEPWKM